MARPIPTAGAGARLAARSDRFGTRLSFEKLEGEGMLTLVDRSPGAAGPFTDLAVTLVSEDGSAVGLRGPGASAMVPAGEYRLVAATAGLADPSGGTPWVFVFSSDAGRPSQKRYQVRAGRKVIVDPFARLEAVVTVEAGERGARAGQPLLVQSRIYTDDGLCINNCLRGSSGAQAFGAASVARIALASPEGKQLDATTAGLT